MEASLSSAPAAPSKAARVAGMFAVVETWVFKPLVQFLLGAGFAIGGLVNAEDSMTGGGSAHSKAIFFSMIAVAFLISSAILASRRRGSTKE